MLICKRNWSCYMFLRNLTQKNMNTKVFKSKIFDDEVVRNSPAFAELLRRSIRTKKDEQYFLKQMALLAKRDLAYEIAKKRKKKNMTQAQLAKDVGTTQAVISRIEKGKVDAGIGLVTRLRVILG